MESCQIDRTRRVSIPLKRVKNSETTVTWVEVPPEKRLNPLKAGQEFGAGGLRRWQDRPGQSQSP